MNSAKELHRVAMQSLQKADEALLKQDMESYKQSMNKALELESSAAMLLKDKISAEPTRSVLFRSSASIAIRCGKYGYAEWLIIQALRGNPPLEIKNELVELSNGIFLQDESVSVSKRLFDIVFSIIVIISLLPLFLLIFLLIKLESNGPAFTKHIRLGFDNKLFYCFKFRTYHVGKEISPTDTEGVGITRLGKYLKVTSLNELPQFFNVLKGDMSVVGPYPLMVRGSKYLFSANEMQYSNLRQMARPGLTGFEPVIMLSKGTKSYAQYVEKWSLFLDLKITYISFMRKIRQLRFAFK